MSLIGNPLNSVAFLTDQFSGNGSTVAFTMSVAPANTASVLVAITGVVQDPSTYSVVGTTLTFSAAPPTGTANISVRYMGIPASGVTTTAYRTVTEFTATSGQTTFSVPSYTIGYIDVFRNGARLGAADFTASSGTTVVLAAAATLGDLIVTESFYVSSVLNAIPATAGAVNSTYLADSAVQTAKLDAAAVTQAKIAAGVAGTGPAFSAWLASANQTIPASTFTKIALSVEGFDTNSNFDNTTNYRFTPTVAGYYQINASVSLTFTATGTYEYLGVFAKSGDTDYQRFGDLYQVNIPSNPSARQFDASTLLYFNGSTDYLELYVYQSSGANATATGSTANGKYTRMSASLVRAA